MKLGLRDRVQAVINADQTGLTGEERNPRNRRMITRVPEHGGVTCLSPMLGQARAALAACRVIRWAMASAVSLGSLSGDRCSWVQGQTPHRAGHA